MNLSRFKCIVLILVISVAIFTVSYIAFMEVDFHKTVKTFPKRRYIQVTRKMFTRKISRTKRIQFPATSAAPFHACPRVSPHLIGNSPVNVANPVDLAAIESELPMVSPGGRWKPGTCTPPQKLAVIIPYRDRERNLHVLLRRLHPFLQRQQRDYGVFLVEQTAEGDFNKGMLMNIGFVEARKNDSRYTCFLFHDTDLIPEDDRNPYMCETAGPMHLAVGLDGRRYKILYSAGFGGVTAFTAEQFTKVNGFSNLFWCWGGEDDDMYQRLRAQHYVPHRPSDRVARYTTVEHTQWKRNNTRRSITQRDAASRRSWEGLKSLRYQPPVTTHLQLYTRVLVPIDKKGVFMALPYTPFPPHTVAPRKKPASRTDRHEKKPASRADPHGKKPTTGGAAAKKQTSSRSAVPKKKPPAPIHKHQRVSKPINNNIKTIVDNSGGKHTVIYRNTLLGRKVTPTPVAVRKSVVSPEHVSNSEPHIDTQEGATVTEVSSTRSMEYKILENAIANGML